MRPVIIAGNWKMHTTPRDAGDLAATIARRTHEPGVVRVICPPFVCLAAVRDALAAEPAGRGVAVGAQNVSQHLAGAFTGEVSAAMLEGLATWVIVGHSERRRDAGETDAIVNAKLHRALDAGLRAIVCVGEQLEERESGRAEAVVEAQVRACLDGVALSRARLTEGTWLTIAYEPVWAIGTGRTARGRDAAGMAEVIRAAIGAAGTGIDGSLVSVLYGGSVTSAAIDEFLAEPSIDGALVGGASLK